MVLQLSIATNFNWLLITQDKMHWLFWSVQGSANHFWHKLCVIIAWWDYQTHVYFKICGWLWRNFTSVLEFTQYMSCDDHHWWHKLLGKSINFGHLPFGFKPVTQQVSCSSVPVHQNVQKATCLTLVGSNWMISVCVVCVSVFSNCLCL